MHKMYSVVNCKSYCYASDEHCKKIHWQHFVKPAHNPEGQDNGKKIGYHTQQPDAYVAYKKNHKNRNDLNFLDLSILL